MLIINEKSDIGCCVLIHCLQLNFKVHEFEGTDDINRIPTYARWGWRLLQEVSRFVEKRRCPGICRMQ